MRVAALMLSYSHSERCRFPKWGYMAKIYYRQYQSRDCQLHRRSKYRPLGPTAMHGSGLSRKKKEMTVLG